MPDEKYRIVRGVARRTTSQLRQGIMVSFADRSGIEGNQARRWKWCKEHRSKWLADWSRIASEKTWPAAVFGRNRHGEETAFPIVGVATDERDEKRC
jgi:hypothetical protein